MAKHKFTSENAATYGAKGGRKAVENGTLHKLTKEESSRGGKACFERLMQTKPQTLLSLKPKIRGFYNKKGQPTDE